MKNKLIFLLFILTSCNTHKTNNVKKGNYIKFSHSGFAMKYIRPLIISTQPCKCHLNADELSSLGPLLEKSNITESEKEMYYKLLYNYVKTDSLTYATVAEFVKNNTTFYTNNIHRNSGDYFDMHIIAEGEKYDIYFMLTLKFFKKLKTELIEKKCDKNVIRGIDML